MCGAFEIGCGSSKVRNFMNDKHKGECRADGDMVCIPKKAAKKRFKVRGEYPHCACGDVSFLGPEVLREKFIGEEKEVEIVCPACGAKHKAKVEEDVYFTGC